MVLSALIVLTALNIRFACAHLFIAGYINTPMPSACAVTEAVCYLLIVYINLFPMLTVRKISTTRNKIMEDGAALLQIFLSTTVIECIFTSAVLITVLADDTLTGTGLNYLLVWVRHLILAFLTELILFWNGIIRVYLTSVQLGMKWRVIGIICGWIPIAQIYALCKIIRISGNEVIYENEKYLLNQIRAENEECRTRYPILLVHGVFFRDFRFFNYWGRIPAELKRNGATIFYGNQQSAASVERCGEELTERIKQIIQETGCEKVNIIAHSKGGLDSRYAISVCGAAD